jgi:DUF1365 family protein
MHSALYRGSVTHTRTSPVNHSFRYTVTMAYLDLAELPTLLRSLRLLGGRRFLPFAFLESDHRQGSGESLDDEIRGWVHRVSGKSCTGPIRLLTQLRYWGYYFSPLNLYYCFAADGKTLEHIVAEVSNTPWRETHRYLLSPCFSDDAAHLSFEHPKDFHVSPFMDMDLRYRWSLSQPNESVHVGIRTLSESDSFFSASMKLDRRPLTDLELARTLCRHPWMTAQTVTAIYWQAFRLWWKKCPFYTHPKKLTAHSSAPTS